MAGAENKIQLAVIKYLKSEGVFCWRANNGALWDSKLQIYRSNPYSLNGVPDIISVINGIFVGWEIKTLKGKQSADQILFERVLTRNGGKYFLIHSLDEAKEMLSELNRG